MPINKIIFNQIKKMFQVDQDLRSSGSDTQLSKKIQNSSLNWGLINYLIYMLDGTHNYKINKLIKDYGYPSSKLIGKRGMYYFFVLVLHQDSDNLLQSGCIEHCDFNFKDSAYLIDRIKINKGEKQIYGTQFEYDKRLQKLVPKPIENPTRVDIKRKECGLGPLSVEMALINEKRLKLAKLNFSKS